MTMGDGLADAQWMARRIALEERPLDPNLVTLETALAVRGHAVPTGWEGSRPRSRRFLAGVTLSFYGDWLTTVALVVLLFRMSGAAAPAGYMVARVLPRLVSGGPGGALADRVPPHWLVAICALVQGVLTVSIVASSRAGALWAVYFAVALAQFCGGLARPAVGALVPRVAPPESLDRANALYSLGLSSSIAVGPALAAVLLAFTTPETLLVLDAVTFLVAAILMLSLRLRPVPSGEAAGRTGAFAGAQVVWRDPLLRTVAASWASSGLVATTASSVLVLVARTISTDSRVGFLYAAVGGGAVLCSVAVLRLKPRRISRDLICLFALLEAVTLAVLTLRPPFGVAVVLLAASGGSGIVYQTWGAIDLQRRSQPSLLGRINAVMVTAMSLGMLVGASLALGLVNWLGWERTLFTACSLAVAVIAAGVVVGPQRSAA